MTMFLWYAYCMKGAILGEDHIFLPQRWRRRLAHNSKVVFELWLTLLLFICFYYTKKTRIKVFFCQHTHEWYSASWCFIYIMVTWFVLSTAVTNVYCLYTHLMYHYLATNFFPKSPQQYKLSILIIKWFSINHQYSLYGDSRLVI